MRINGHATCSSDMRIRNFDSSSDTQDAFLTIIIPAYNAEDTIVRSVRSALAIGSALSKVIVVNDGSSDGTRNLLEQLSKDDSRLLVITQDNCGRSFARNVGFAASCSDWVMFLDADDYLFPGDYEELILAAEKKDLDLVVCSYLQPNIVKSCSSDICQAVSDMKVVHSGVLLNAMIDGLYSETIDKSLYELNASWARLYRSAHIRQLVDRLGDDLAPFPIGLRFSEDRLFNLEYLWQLHDGRVGFVPFCLYYWDLDSSSTCANVRPSDTDSLALFASIVEQLKNASVFSVKDEHLIVGREFMEQFKRAVLAASQNLSVKSSWLTSFDRQWLRNHTLNFPADCLGKRGEWRVAAALLPMGHLGLAFAVYGAMTTFSSLLKRFCKYIERLLGK